MPVKSKNPITPGQRFHIANDFSQLTKQKPEKSLSYFRKERAGRNNRGRVTVPHRGGRHKRLVRIVDFHRRKYGVPAVVKAVVYDPGRSAFLVLLYYKDGEKAYALAPKGIEVGDEVVAGEKVLPEVGNTMPLRSIPVGTLVHNVELNKGAGGVLARSAGAYVQLMAHQEKNVVLKLPSGEVRMVNKECQATVGVVSNTAHNTTQMGKAGRKRWLGRRPRVRATVMNPVDHPMGGGEGKATGGHPRSRLGLYAKGKRTRRPKKYSDKMILKRRK